MSLKQKILSKAKIALETKKAFLLSLPKYDIGIDQDIKFFFHYYDPDLIDINSEAEKKTGDPLLPPFDEHMHVCDLTTDGANHHVIINMFMQSEGHVVLSSAEQSATQGSDLGSSDFKAFEQVLNAFENKGIAYYNAGPDSGCSQMHKHIQYAPIDETPLLDAMIAREKLPFVYHTVKLNGTSSNDVIAAYKELMNQAKNDPSHTSYNFVIKQNSATYIPRTMSKHPCGFLVNSVAMCGHFTIWKECDPIITNSPLKVLSDICIPVKK